MTECPTLAGDPPMLAENAIGGRVPMHDAEQLVGLTGVAHIKLGGAVYTLRVTKSGKLILTK